MTENDGKGYGAAIAKSKHCINACKDVDSLSCANHRETRYTVACGNTIIPYWVYGCEWYATQQHPTLLYC